MQTLADAQAWLRGRVDDGAQCPCCTQFAKVYKRPIHSNMARSLILFYRRCGMAWGYKPDVLRGVGSSARDESLLRYWGLFAEDPTRAGWWQVTPAGRAWLLGHTTVPRYARVYDGRCLGLTGSPWSVKDALGTKFDLAELMSA